METTNVNKSGLRKATRQKALLRLGLAGASGSGKTVSALILAYGITGDWAKVALIDTENGSADLYANHTLPDGFLLGEFNVLPIQAPYHPNKYIEAIKTCEQSGMEVIIIDSITHEWNGKGGCLELHDQATNAMKIPNSFTSWAKITPLHQAFIDSILQSSRHIITCVRSKTDYVLSEKNGRQVPQKVGMAAQTRDGFEYELTLSLDLDLDHKAFPSKDRTGLFSGKDPKIITPETGKMILEWCKSGADVIPQTKAVPSAKTVTPSVKVGYIVAGGGAGVGQFATGGGGSGGRVGEVYPITVGGVYPAIVKEYASIFDLEDELKKCKDYAAQAKLWNSLSKIEKAKPIVINLFKDRSLKSKTEKP